MKNKIEIKAVWLKRNKKDMKREIEIIQNSEKWYSGSIYFKTLCTLFHTNQHKLISSFLPLPFLLN